MWLSKKLSEDSRNYEKDEAQIGNLTIANGSTVAASSSSEVRGVPIFCPSGIRFSPCENQKILLFKANGKTVSAGTLMESDASLLPGEIQIFSAGGASITLKNNGNVIINGKCTIDKYGNIDTAGNISAADFIGY